MQLFIIAALLLSAVAAVPPRPGQPGKPVEPNKPGPHGSGGQPGKPQEPNKPGPYGPGGQPGKPQEANKPGPHGSGGQPGKPQEANKPGPHGPGGKSKGEGHHRNPGPLVFSPTFKVENVTFQNATNATLPEGENVFLMPKFGERRPHPHQGENRGSPFTGQYVKLTFNSTLPNKFSMEFGDFKPMNIGALVMEEDDDE